MGNTNKDIAKTFKDAQLRQQGSLMPALSVPSPLIQKALDSYEPMFPGTVPGVGHEEPDDPYGRQPMKSVAAPEGNAPDFKLADQPTDVWPVLGQPAGDGGIAIEQQTTTVLPAQSQQPAEAETNPARDPDE